MTPPPQAAAAERGPDRTPLHVYSAGFLGRGVPRRDRTVRRILELSGHALRLGLPGAGGRVAVWGAAPSARRGAWVARLRGAALLRVEDAFLRSLHPGRAGAPPLGLLLDSTGLHFDPSGPSDLETLLATHPLDDPALLDRAAAAIARLRAAHLSKYSAVDPALPHPDPGYVLVIDQARGDASVRASGGSAAAFRAMLAEARAAHPGRPIVIKTHPETAAGHRPGHFAPADLDDGTTLCTAPLSPWALLDGAAAVYVFSSQMGFEAILAGHRPRVFGLPFYAGWGLSDDAAPAPPRRGRRLTPAQLFAAAMILAPVWYDPHHDRLCALEDVIDILEARARAWREDRAGWVASGMRLWKRSHLQRMFGAARPVIFDAGPPPPGRRHMAWGAEGRAEVRVEDGFLRSRGLGAALVPPLSLVLDDLGIYYDPRRESRLERLLATAPELPEAALSRARALRGRLRAAGLSKYNLPGAPLPELPQGRRILVPGQVEDDVSIRLGTGDVATNRGLLAAARAANPGAVLIYKPHPDVAAGLRPGAVPGAAALADVVLETGDPAPLLEAVDEVWTMTSLTGFEALLREVPVTTLGAPFYAGWGLTTDLGPVPARRRARLTLDQMVHATLIAYPRYFDPVTGTAAPPEVIVDRLAAGDLPPPGPVNRALSRLQGLLATQAHLWR